MSVRARIRIVSMAIGLALAGCGDPEQPGSLPPSMDGSGCVPECTGNAGMGESGESGGEDPFECGEKTIMPELARSRVLLVLDRSGSMGAQWDHDGDPQTPASTRWAVLHAMVVDIVQAFDAQLDLGLLMFPSATTQCSVDGTPEVEVGAGAGAAILAELPPADAPPDPADTPTVSALEAGRAHLQSLDEDGARAMVLVTDGEPTCGQGLGAAAQVVGAAYEEDGIVTYAVGLAVPPSAVAGFEAVAQAGGAPASGEHAFYDIQTQAELESAVAEVAQTLQSCLIALDPEPQIPEKLELRLDGDPVPRIEDCAADDGWMFADPYTQVVLCGSWCDRLKNEEGAELVADYECPPITPGP